MKTTKYTDIRVSPPTKFVTLPMDPVDLGCGPKFASIRGMDKIFALGVFMFVAFCAFVDRNPTAIQIRIVRASATPGIEPKPDPDPTPVKPFARPIPPTPKVPRVEIPLEEVTLTSIQPARKTRYRVSSGFGRRVHPVTRRRVFHKGVDIPMREGTPIRNPEYGRVTKITSSGYGGLCVTVKHMGKARYTRYCHLSQTLVNVNQYVKKGHTLALSGKSGRATGPHLHLELRENNDYVNPTRLIPKVLKTL